MAYTQADLDRLESAIARGVRRVTVDGQTVEYGSLEELRRARDFVASKLEGRKRRAVRVYTSKGF